MYLLDGMFCAYMNWKDNSEQLLGLLIGSLLNCVVQDNFCRQHRSYTFINLPYINTLSICVTHGHVLCNYWQLLNLNNTLQF